MAVALRENARVLMIRMSALGDVIFALEALASLKEERPDVSVDFLVEDRFAGLLEGHPQLAEVLVFPRKNKWAIPGQLWRLRRKKYDVVLDLHGNMKSSLQVLYSRARLKVGFQSPVAREGSQRFYHRRVRVPEPLPHRAERGLFLLRELGLAGDPRQPVIPVRTDVPDCWDGQAGKRVVLHPGTSEFAAFKRWPLERFVALARRLLDHGCAVGLSHGPDERWMVEKIRAEAPRAFPVDGDLGLRGLAAVLRDADVVVAADTGPLHIAAAMGTPVVALFGPKEVSWFGPRGDGHAVLYHDVPCRPCLRRRCASAQCVLGLPVETVEEAVLQTASAKVQ
ncbi:MAG: glycosyltransferase family 9 protein [Planctomycetota bacterium]|jgi:lipopolysaccharide heptosyltransferase I